MILKLLFNTQSFYSNDMQDVYKNVKENNVDTKRKILIIFYDMIAHMINDKKLN